jgi:cytochrome c oxidase subunit 3
MATTIHEPPQLRPTRLPGDTSGNGGGRNLIPSTGTPLAVQDYAEPPASTAMWVLIAAIVMTFAAFSSALIVRQGGAPDWQHLTLPPILYLNSFILILSSVTLELSRRQITAFKSSHGTTVTNPYSWLSATLFMGLLFVAGQYVAWLQLRAQGVYMATSPNSSFFYLFTVLHALHVLGGITGMLYVMFRLHQGVLRRSTLVAACRYWHFMGVLWLYLLFLLWSRI